MFDEAVGTVLFIAVLGLIFGDEVGKKVAVGLLALGCVVGLFFATEMVVGLIFAPIVVVLLLLGGLIGFLRNL